MNEEEVDALAEAIASGIGRKGVSDGEFLNNRDDFSEVARLLKVITSDIEWTINDIQKQTIGRGDVTRELSGFANTILNQY